MYSLEISGLWEIDERSTVILCAVEYNIHYLHMNACTYVKTHYICRCELVKKDDFCRYEMENKRRESDGECQHTCSVWNRGNYPAYD